MTQMAMGQNLWCHFWVDEHPFTIYFDVHQGYKALTQSQMSPQVHQNCHCTWAVCLSPLVAMARRRGNLQEVPPSWQLMAVQVCCWCCIDMDVYQNLLLLILSGMNTHENQLFYDVHQNYRVLTHTHIVI